MRMLGVERGSLDGHFLGHVLVDVGDLRPLVARICDDRAIHNQLHAAIWLRAIGGKVSNRPAVDLGKRTVPLRVPKPAVHGHPRHQTDQLRRIAPLDRNLAYHGVIQGRAGDAAVRWNWLLGGRHLYRFRHGTHFQRDVRHRPALLLIDDDAFFLPS